MKTSFTVQAVAKEQLTKPMAFRISAGQEKRFEAIVKGADRQKSDMLRRVFEAGLKAFERRKC